MKSLSNPSRLPTSPGVYTFRSKKGLLYIGKAANIRERVKSHFTKPSYRDNLFIDKVEKISFLKTDSEIEALILEAKLIKKHQPKYNVLWKDDKNYSYVAVTKESFPRIFITHQIKKIRASDFHYIGPFVDGAALKQTLKILRKVFPYRTCRNLPKRPCLWYHLDRCPAPCLIASMKKECRINTRNIMKILRGKKSQVLSGLKKEMAKMSMEEKFESAGEIRNQTRALERIMAHAHISQPTKAWEYLRAEAYDISNIQGESATGSMIVFTDGRADKSQYRKFRIKMAQKPNDVAMLKEVLSRRFQHTEWPYPGLILIDGGKAQLNAAKNCATLGVEHPVRIVALAKKNNKLYIDNEKNPVLLKNMPQNFSGIIIQLRDEAHRFAKKYHHQLRKAELTDARRL